jgi:hypothetical protein
MTALRRNGALIPWVLVALANLALMAASGVRHEWADAFDHFVMACLQGFVVFLLWVIRSDREDHATLRADAWDLGYYRGARDAELDMEPADNPYREVAQ